MLEGDLQPTISRLIRATEHGDRAASEKLFGTLYSELHRIAKHEIGRRGGSVSISATTLLHEAYLAMAARGDPSFPDRPRFMGYAARVMRRLIIDHARERKAQKRGGLFEITSLDTNAMGKVEPALAEIVDLKFFCGLSFGEIAAMRDVSERTVQRNWERARLYLHRRIRADLPL